MLRGSANRWGRRGRRRAEQQKPVRREVGRTMALPSIALRVGIVAGIALAFFAIILFRLWFLQILSGDEFLARANDNRLRSIKIVAPRGAIQDRTGKVIVDNRPGLAVGIRRMDVSEEQLPVCSTALRACSRLHRRSSKLTSTITAGTPMTS